MRNPYHSTPRVNCGAKCCAKLSMTLCCNSAASAANKKHVRTAQAAPGMPHYRRLHGPLGARTQVLRSRMPWQPCLSRHDCTAVGGGSLCIQLAQGASTNHPVDHMPCTSLTPPSCGQLFSMLRCCGYASAPAAAHERESDLSKCSEQRYVNSTPLLSFHHDTIDKRRDIRPCRGL